MVFSSLIFCFCFFPLNMLFYWLMPTLEKKNRVMLIFSLIFYAWGGPIYLLLIMGMTFADWIAAMLIESRTSEKGRKSALIGGVAINLGLLCIFKYLTFILENFHNIFGVPDTVLQIALPIGISFYTFQLLSYMVDVYRKDVPAQKKYFTLLLYVSLFHQCIAGPIIRYETVYRELTDRSVTSEDIWYGIRRFSIGLAKKAILANQCGALADTFLVATSSTDGAATLMGRPALSILLGTICYTLQIYLDFSAYSDMAIGMGRMIGFHYMENFNFPYISKTITEFWRRWHISLSTFFRDYVYIPLGGNRCKVGRHIFNLLVVWALTGFWHGASWNYLLWGLFYFVFLIIEKYLFPQMSEKLPSLVQHIYALLVINLGWMIFRCEDISWLWIEIKGLFGLNGNGFSSLETITNFNSNIIFLIVAIIAVTPFWKTLGVICNNLGKRNAVCFNVYQVIQIIVPIVLIILSAATLVGDSYNPFMYLRF